MFKKQENVLNQLRQSEKNLRSDLHQTQRNIEKDGRKAYELEKSLIEMKQTTQENDIFIQQERRKSQELQTRCDELASSLATERKSR